VVQNLDSALLFCDSYVFSQFLQRSSGVVLRGTTVSTSFPIHYSLVIMPFETSYSSTDTVVPVHVTQDVGVWRYCSTHL